VNSKVRAPRMRRLLPLAAVLAGVGGATLSTAGTAVAQSCDSDFAVHASALGARQSCPEETFSSDGTATLGDITQGDFSELSTTTDPPTPVEIRRNLDPDISCIYQNRVYQPLSGDLYNVIVNGGSTVNEPTLNATLNTAVPGGLTGARNDIALGKAQVCFASPRQFVPKPGSPLLTQNDPGFGVQYVALLPDCRAPITNRPPGPCVSSRSATLIGTPTGSTGVVTVTVIVPPGWDPRIHG
jgi:hypothetical protein